jgi:hypothetical protein
MSCAGSASKKPINEWQRPSSDDAVLQIKTLKLESVARDDARWAGMLPVAGSEPVHLAASQAGLPKSLILKRNAVRSQRQEGKVPGAHSMND